MCHTLVKWIVILTMRQPKEKEVSGEGAQHRTTTSQAQHQQANPITLAVLYGSLDKPCCKRPM